MQSVLLAKLDYLQKWRCRNDYALRIYQSNTTINNVTIKNTTDYGTRVETALSNIVYNSDTFDLDTLGGSTNALRIDSAITMNNSQFYGVNVTNGAGIYVNDLRYIDI